MSWLPHKDMHVPPGVKAQFNLGLMYRDGKGVAQDFTKARKWFELAAAQGDAEAQCSLGVMYEK